MLENILEKIIKKGYKDETHEQIVFLGFIKYTYLNKEAREIKKNNIFYKYKKQNLDITKIPPAEGQLRDMQLAHLVVLKEFDRICKENNLTYWIDFGTLLGAVRHKGFIPWDDDVDVSMLYDDYLKIKDIFNSSTQLKDVSITSEIDYTTNNYWLRIKHNTCADLMIDIFPFYQLETNYSDKERFNITKEIKEYRKSIPKNCSEAYHILSKKQLELLSKSNSEGDLAYGIEFGHNHKFCVFSKSEIFPLKEICFEGLNFPTVCNINKYLNEIYGDYMEYPKKIGAGHSLCKKLSEEDVKTITDLIGKG